MAASDQRVEVCKFGLSDRDQTIPLHNAGTVAASIAGDKDPVSPTTDCEFRSASEWFADNLSRDELVYVKINVEGAEAALVADLCASGEVGKIDHLLIHLDVRKFPSLAHLAQPLLNQLDESGIEYRTAESIEFGGVTRGTKNWLKWCDANERYRDFRYVTLSRWEHAVRLRLYPLKVRLMQSR